MDRVETCAKCGTEGRREFVPRRVELCKTAVQHAEYNPGLGCVVKNAQHRAEIARSKGLEEIGSEKIETVHKTHDTARSDAWERGWDKVDAGQWVGNGQSIEITTPTTETKASE